MEFGEPVKKRAVIIASVLIGTLALGIVSAVKLKEWNDKRQYGILLAFDDYSVASWEEHFDLFDKYGVKVTFFINTSEPTEFCDKAVKRGHEIGFHTKSHAKMTSLTEEEFYEEAIEPLQTFESQNYNITSFAYPYGEYEDWMNVKLLQYYDTVRGAWIYKGYTRDSIYKGFVESMSIDNIHFDSDEQFRKEIRRHLKDLKACDPGTIVSLFAHAIDDGQWCISEKRLEILFEEAQNLDIHFYTFQDLQK